MLIGIGVLIAVADAEMAGILRRYFADFSIMFLMAAVLLLFIVNENIENGSKAHAVFVRVLPATVAIGVAYTVLLCITAETGWVSDAYHGHTKVCSKRSILDEEPLRQLPTAAGQAEGDICRNF